ncbi:MAG: type 4a pilus biogenesis protein PilO [Candidatus Cloacimonetes bacterium]|nr:type 4a pilus biogenesis protein PilO [Candidatus Cloacimonadota bacterium]
MNIKHKYLILACVMILVTLCFFYFTGSMISNKIKEINRVDNKIRVEQEKLNSAKVLNEQLQEVSKVIVNSITKDRSYSSEETNAFIKKLADLADRYKIAVNTLVPKEIDSYGSKYIEHLYTMELDCTFIQMGQFLSDLESFDNIIKIKTLDVRPLSQDKKNVAVDLEQETRYKVTLELSTFKIVKEA